MLSSKSSNDLSISQGNKSMKHEDQMSSCMYLHKFRETEFRVLHDKWAEDAIKGGAFAIVREVLQAVRLLSTKKRPNCFGPFCKCRGS